MIRISKDLSEKPVNIARIVKAFLLLSTIILLLSGCVTPPTQGSANGPRFREESYVDVALEFQRWDSITFARPEYRENGFIQIYSREHLSPMLTGSQFGHELAVVVIGWTYQNAELAQVVGEWKTLLSSCGFKRVVCLRAGVNNRIDGLSIIDDTSLPVYRAKQTARL